MKKISRFFAFKIILKKFVPIKLKNTWKNRYTYKNNKKNQKQKQQDEDIDFTKCS